MQASTSSGSTSTTLFTNEDWIHRSHQLFRELSDANANREAIGPNSLSHDQMNRCHQIIKSLEKFIDPFVLARNHPILGGNRFYDYTASAFYRSRLWVEDFWKSQAFCALEYCAQADKRLSEEDNDATGHHSISPDVIQEYLNRTSPFAPVNWLSDSNAPLALAILQHCRTKISSKEENLQWYILDQVSEHLKSLNVIFNCPVLKDGGFYEAVLAFAPKQRVIDKLMNIFIVCCPIFPNIDTSKSLRTVAAQEKAAAETNLLFTNDDWIERSTQLFQELSACQTRFEFQAVRYQLLEANSGNEVSQANLLTEEQTNRCRQIIDSFEKFIDPLVQAYSHPLLMENRFFVYYRPLSALGSSLRSSGNFGDIGNFGGIFQQILEEIPIDRTFDALENFAKWSTEVEGLDVEATEHHLIPQHVLPDVLKKLFNQIKSLEQIDWLAALNAPLALAILQHCQKRFGRQDKEMQLCITIVRQVREYLKPLKVLFDCPVLKDEQFYDTVLSFVPPENEDLIEKIRGVYLLCGPVVNKDPKIINEAVKAALAAQEKTKATPEASANKNDPLIGSDGLPIVGSSMPERRRRLRTQGFTQRPSPFSSPLASLKNMRAKEEARKAAKAQIQAAAIAEANIKFWRKRIYKCRREAGAWITAQKEARLEYHDRYFKQVYEGIKKLSELKTRLIANSISGIYVKIKPEVKKILIHFIFFKLARIVEKIMVEGEIVGQNFETQFNGFNNVVKNKSFNPFLNRLEPPVTSLEINHLNLKVKEMHKLARKPETLTQEKMAAQIKKKTCPAGHVRDFALKLLYINRAKRAAEYLIKNYTEAYNRSVSLHL